MLIKSYSANIYQDGKVVGSITATCWFWRPAFRMIPPMRRRAKEAYGESVRLADVRRL